MKGEILIQNIINIFIMAIILEAAIMAIFSMSTFKGIRTNRAIESTRDFIIVIVAFFLCWKVQTLRVFVRTGLRIPSLFDVVISTLVLTRLTIFIRQLMSRLKSED